MAASHPLSSLKVPAATQSLADPNAVRHAPVVRTAIHSMSTGTGARSARRRITPEAGFALEVLGHAIEYLADEYVHEAGSLPFVHTGDPRLEAMQTLMAANRQVYFACPLMPSLVQRIRGRLLGRNPAARLAPENRC